MNKKTTDNYYYLFSVTTVVVSALALSVIWTQPLSAQEKQSAIATPLQMSAEIISWLKTGMSVVFILTLLFGAHNMWLHNKFTGFKEQTILIIREEFRPKFEEIQRTMVKKEEFEHLKEMQTEILKRIEERVAFGQKDLTDATAELKAATETLHQAMEHLKKD